MKIYKNEFEDKIINYIYNITDNKESQRKHMSVYSYMDKYWENGKLKYSRNKLHKMYQRHHIKISKSYFYDLIANLMPIFTEVSEELSEGLSEIEKPIQSLKDTSLEPNLEKPNNIINNINYTNTVKRSGFLTRKDLRLLAQDIMDKTGIRDILVNTLVIKKINNLKTKIHTNGAIAYLKKVITEKLTETTLEYCVDRDRENELLHQLGAFL